ncbi:MAG: mechanosensitive ion channel family protein [Betaproteobacteria bacterium]
MWEQVDLILRQAMRQIADNVANFLPGVLVALFLVLVTFVVATLVRVIIVRALRGLERRGRADPFGFAALAGWPPSANPPVTAGRIAYWTIVVLGLLASLTALNATIPSRLALSVFGYVPHLLAALVILIVGAITARFLARSVLIGAVNMHLRSARLLSLTVKWLVLLVAVAMALEHLGIGRTVLLLAFGIIFGGIVFAAALAVGLGARDAVARALERQLQEPARDGEPIDHV